MLPHGLVVLATLAEPAAVQAAARADGGEQAAEAPRNAAGEAGSPSIILDLPVEIDGAYARDLAVGVAADGRTALLRADRFQALLREHVSDAFLATLDLPDGETFLTVEEASRAGLTVAYDPAALRLRIGLPSGARRTRTVSLSAARGERPADALDAPRLSVGLNVFAEPAYRFGDAEGALQPFAARTEGFANVGGFSGVNLAWRGRFTEGADEPWTFDDIVLFHDRFEQAIRFAVGTLRATPVNTYARVPRLIGGAVTRDYPAIQPFTNLRPDGGTSFTLERESVVVIEVNGQVASTEVLAPGSYDLSDLPVRPGGNDVVVYTEEGANRIELAVLSPFVDTRLLEGGRTIFGLLAGAEQAESGVLPRAGEGFVYAGYAEHGLNDQVTLGAGLNGRDGEVMATARGAVGLRAGLLAAEGAWRAGEGGGAGAATLRYSWRSNPRARRGETFDVQISTADAGFGPVTTPLRDVFGAPFGPARHEASVRYGLRFDRVALSASVQGARVGPQDRVNASLSVATSIGAYALSLTGRLDAIDDPVQGRSNDPSVLFTLSRRLGRNARLRSSYDSRNDRVQAQALRFGGQALGDWNANLSVFREAAGRGLDAGAGLITNRAALSVNLRAQDTDGRETGTVRGVVGVGLGYADGRVALGRPINDGFVIASTHASLGERELTLVRAGEPAARNGLLGPALLPLRGAYRTERSDVRVEDLPVGYDIGTGTLVTFAGGRAGYAVTIGSGASNTVMGTLLQADGTPMALAVGRLAPEGAPEQEGAGFFTNRTGRFVAEGLTAGTYEVRLKPTDAVVGTVTIPEDADGLVRAGEIRMTER